MYNDEERDELARQYFEGNPKRCGACGEDILRWTSKCLFLPEEDNLPLCNKNGCVDAWKEAPRCVGCEARINPFHEDFEFHRKARRCEPCFWERQENETQTLADDIAASHLTPQLFKWYGEGPYVVLPPVEGKYYTYRVVHDKVRNDVRSTKGTAADACKRAAEFNRVHWQDE